MSEQITRRDAIKRAIYIAPAILTLTAVPAFASNGSGSPRPSVQSQSWLEKNDPDNQDSQGYHGNQDNQGRHGNQDNQGHYGNQGNHGHHGNQ
jgi:hypothetical protein